MDLEATKHPDFACAKATIGPDRADLRMQDALVGLFPQWLPSRKSCRKALDRGTVLLNGVRATTGRRVTPGDQVVLNLPSPAALDPGPAAPQFLQTKRTDGADFLFVWKPAGLATSGSGRLNLANILRFMASGDMEEMRRALTPNRGDALNGPQPVHRLDRNTAGWVCVALNFAAAESLGKVFAERTVKKRYIALVAGILGAGSNRQPLDGKEAVTRWSPRAHGALPVHGTATLLDVVIETGRTHQIRRHLAAAGHPIVGEDQYPPPGMDIADAPRYTGHGLFLCAVELDIPAGLHGPAMCATGSPPRKFTRIRWVADALRRQDTEAS